MILITMSATSPPRLPMTNVSSTGPESMCHAFRSTAGPMRNITPPTTISTSCTKICSSAAADIAEKIIRIYASNYIPKRTFRGPVFLSGNGLWVDWRDNWELNRAIEKIMMRFEGQHSVFDIAEQVGLDYWMVRDYVEKFRAKGFIVPQPIPSEAQVS